MRRILLAIAAGLVMLFGAAPATPAWAEPAGAEECPVDDPTWQIAWASQDTVTLRECGGEGGWSESGATGGGQLPVTGLTAGVAVGAAIILVGLGVGMYLLPDRRRHPFRI
jgi:hypothetical protein